MSDAIKSLASLFQLSSSPVIGIRGNELAYCNPATGKFFSEDISSYKISELLPRWPYSPGSVVSTTILGRNCIVTVSEFEELLVLSMAEAVNEKSVSTIPINALTSMASTITTLRMASDRLSDLCEKGKPQDMYFSIFYHNYYKLLRTTKHLSTLTYLASGKWAFNPSQIELGTFISDILSSVNYLVSELEINIEYVLPDELITINADATLIEQMVLGLISNSLQHTAKNGKITLRVYKSQENAVIAIDDTGEGIAPDTLSTVFLPKKLLGPLEIPDSESGLGLPLASLIAAEHGGTIMLDSREGKGTSIRVMLKASPEAFSSLKSPTQQYGNQVPVHALTELSVVLSREQYTRDKIINE